jgi:hypothetical protein
VKIKKTRLESKDVLRVQLAGAVRADVTAVRKGRKFFFVAPERLGGTREVPADSLTDCANYSVWEMGKKLSAARSKKKKRASS